MQAGLPFFYLPGAAGPTPREPLDPSGNAFRQAYSLQMTSRSLTALLVVALAMSARAGVVAIPRLGPSLGAQTAAITPVGVKPETFVSGLTSILLSPDLIAAPAAEPALTALALAEAALIPAKAKILPIALAQASKPLTPSATRSLIKIVQRAQEASPEALRALAEAAARLKSSGVVFDGADPDRVADEAHPQAETSAPHALPKGASATPSKCPFHFLWGGKPPPVLPGNPIAPARLSWVTFAWWSLTGMGDPLGVLIKIHERFGDKPVEVRFPTGQRWLFSSDPAVTTRALVKTTEQPGALFRKSELQSRPLAAMVGRENLFLGEGSLWSRTRKLLAPLFSPGRVNSAASYHQILETMDAGVAALKARANAAPGGVAEVSLPDEATRLTLDALLRALFRAELTPAELDELGAAYRVSTDWLSKEAANPINVGLSRWPTFSPGHRRLKRAYATIDRYAARLLDEHRGAQEGATQDMIDLLDSATDENGAPLSRAEKLSQLKTMMLAGHETTATLLSWTFYALATNDEARTKLVAEVDRVLEGRTEIWPDDVRAMPYLNSVLSETLRLYSPAYVIARHVEADQRVGTDAGLVELKKETTLIMTPFMTHRRDAQWGTDASGFDAKLFRPERFDLKAHGSEGRSLDDLKTFAFGYGPRICLGMHFAMAEAKLALIRYLQEFEIVPHAGAAARGSDISVKIVGGVTLRVKSRR